MVVQGDRQVDYHARACAHARCRYSYNFIVFATVLSRQHAADRHLLTDVRSTFRAGAPVTCGWCHIIRSCTSCKCDARLCFTLLLGSVLTFLKFTVMLVLRLTIMGYILTMTVWVACPLAVGI
jgi:hypothetical protein